MTLVEAVVTQDMVRAFDIARRHYALTLEILEAGLSKASTPGTGRESLACVSPAAKLR